MRRQAIVRVELQKPFTNALVNLAAGNGQADKAYIFVNIKQSYENICVKKKIIVHSFLHE